MVGIWRTHKGLLIILTLLLLVFPPTACCNNFQEDLQFVLVSNPIVGKARTSEFNFKKSSDLELLSVGVIKVYQLAVSSQDERTCIFVPSCSRFGVESIHKYGIIKGILLTSDRLQRCNSLSRSKYHIDETTGKAIDPVNYYSFERK